MDAIEQRRFDLLAAVGIGPLVDSCAPKKKDENVIKSLVRKSSLNKSSPFSGAKKKIIKKGVVAKVVKLPINEINTYSEANCRHLPIKRTLCNEAWNPGEPVDLETWGEPGGC